MFWVASGIHIPSAEVVRVRVMIRNWWRRGQWEIVIGCSRVWIRLNTSYFSIDFHFIFKSGGRSACSLMVVPLESFKLLQYSLPPSGGSLLGKVFNPPVHVGVASRACIGRGCYWLPPSVTIVFPSSFILMRPLRRLSRNGMRPAAVLHCRRRRGGPLAPPSALWPLLHPC